MNDQTAKADAGKPKLSLVSWQIAYDIAEVREYGCEKYGDPDNWKRVELQRYIDALLRHVLAFARDPYGKDPESGIEHYKHAECNLSFISEILAEKPAAEKVNTVPGYKWVKTTVCGHAAHECPECHYTRLTSPIRPPLPYCGQCGLDMRKDGEEE